MIEVKTNNMDIEKEVCPVCECDDYKDNYCNKCKYDFSDMFSCPLLDDEKLLKENIKICNVTKLACTVKGLDFESCDKYHKYSD
jgi:transposase-like protein